ncbi:MAG: Na/Pi cotransporter family protein [Chitinophagales bacterium]
MTYTILDFLQLIGSLGLFIYGMKIMSDALQKLAGEKLRSLLRSVTSTTFSGVLSGFLTTALVQSSSATTVMVVSFVNAGILTLSESMGVVMGANIGTTITAWMIAIVGFKFESTTIALILTGLVFPLLFSRKAAFQNIASFIIGFAVLFLGLSLLQHTIPNIENNTQILDYFDPFINSGFLSTLFFIAAGIILTIILQSSSASMAFTMVILAQGWITFPLAAAMVLGENIGTTVTANIASSIANVHSKRAARFHFFFNFLGVIWMALLLMPFIKGLDFVLSETFSASYSLFDSNPESRQNATIALALFHTAFNVINTVFLFPLIPLFDRLLIRIQPTKDASDEEFRLQYISSGVMSTPELSLEEAQKELQNFGKVLDKMGYSFSALLFDNPKNKKNIIDKLKKREEITDDLELEIVNYLTKVSEFDLSFASSKIVRNMLSIANDMERVADIYYQMTRNYERMQKHNIKLPEDAMQELREFLDLVYSALKKVRKNLNLPFNEVDINEAQELEDQINKMHKDLKRNHYNRLEKNIYSPRAGVIYLDYLNRAEKIADHLINVDEAMAGVK